MSTKVLLLGAGTVGGAIAHLLSAEARVREQLWESPDWRQLTLVDGRLTARQTGEHRS